MNFFHLYSEMYSDCTFVQSILLSYPHLLSLEPLFPTSSPPVLMPSFCMWPLNLEQVWKIIHWHKSSQQWLLKKVTPLPQQPLTLPLEALWAPPSSMKKCSWASSCATVHACQDSVSPSVGSHPFPPCLPWSSLSLGGSNIIVPLGPGAPPSLSLSTLGSYEFPLAAARCSRKLLWGRLHAAQISDGSRVLQQTRGWGICVLMSVTVTAVRRSLSPGRRTCQREMGRQKNKKQEPRLGSPYGWVGCWKSAHRHPSWLIPEAVTWTTKINHYKIASGYAYERLSKLG